MAPPVQQEEEDEGESAGDDGIDEAQQGRILMDTKLEDVTSSDAPSADLTGLQRQNMLEIEDADDTDDDGDEDDDDEEEEEEETHAEDASASEPFCSVEEATSVVDLVDSQSAENQEATSKSESDSESGSDSDKSVNTATKDVSTAVQPSSRPKTSPASMWLGSQMTEDQSQNFEVRGEKLILHSRSEDYFAKLAPSLPHPSKDKQKEKTFTSLTEQELDNLKISPQRPTSVPANVKLGMHSTDWVPGAKEMIRPNRTSEIMLQGASIDSNLGKCLEIQGVGALGAKIDSVLSFSASERIPEGADAGKVSRCFPGDKDATDLDLEDVEDLDDDAKHALHNAGDLGNGQSGVADVWCGMVYESVLHRLSRWEHGPTVSVKDVIVCAAGVSSSYLCRSLSSCRFPVLVQYDWLIDQRLLPLQKYNGWKGKQVGRRLLVRPETQTWGWEG